MSDETPGRLGRPMRSGWPQSFPVAQFPNPPLIVALAAGVVGRFTHGRADDLASSVFYVALAIWAWEEAARGVNWFRRLLGVGGLVYVVVRLASALDG